MNAIDRPSALPADLAVPLDLALGSRGHRADRRAGDLLSARDVHERPRAPARGSRVPGRGRRDRRSADGGTGRGAATHVALAGGIGSLRVGRRPAWTRQPQGMHRAPPTGPRWLTLATGVALAEGLHAASGLPVSIKWPNDLVDRAGGHRARRAKARRRPRGRPHARGRDSRTSSSGSA